MKHLFRDRNQCEILPGMTRSGEWRLVQPFCDEADEIKLLAVHLGGAVAHTLPIDDRLQTQRARVPSRSSIDRESPEAPDQTPRDQECRRRNRKERILAQMLDRPQQAHVPVDEELVVHVPLRSAPAEYAAPSAGDREGHRETTPVATGAPAR
jgi:hypothetical protein